MDPQAIGGDTVHLFILTSDSVRIAQSLCGMSGPPAHTCYKFPAVIASWETGTNAGIS